MANELGKGGPPLVKIGVLGDIHAEDAALAIAIRALRDEGVNAILSVGDIVDGPGSVERCCELLVGAGALAVRGNHERWLLAGTMRDLPDATKELGREAKRFIDSLPRTRRLETIAGSMLLCHGVGEEDMASVNPHDDEALIKYNAPLVSLLGPDGPSIVINGHTHRRLVWRHRQLTVINAGTLYRKHQPCFAVVDLAARKTQYFELEAGKARKGEALLL